ncbi:hypothetical protein RIF29_33601 [Crotalaria pallida]|uniref:non-specific serine/threonine protein kinase n=1 Tax=Crotalaria pallida TaxID=3830 RepID=A0AAN9HU55_CROPI
MPSPNDSSPRNSSPDNATLDNATPDNATPDNATPDNATPDNATPDNSKPDNSTSNKSTPEKSTPVNSKPDNSTSDKLIPASSPSDNSAPDKSTPVSPTPNNSTLNKSPPDNSAPDKSTSDKSKPDKSTSDKSTPDKSTSDKSTSDKSTPDNSAPDKSTSDKSTPDNSTPEKAKSDKSTLISFAPNNPEPDKSTPNKSTQDNSTPDKSTPVTSTPDKSAPGTSTPDKATPVISSPDNSTPEKSKPDNSTPDKPTPDNSTPNISIPTNSPRDKSTNNSTPKNSTPIESTSDNSTPQVISPPENSTPEKSTPIQSTYEKSLPDKSTSVNSKNVNSTLDNSNTSASPGSSSSASPNKSLPTEKAVPSGGNNDNKALVGGAIGGVLVLLIMIIICVIWSKKKNRKQKQKYYYGGPPSTGIGDNNGFNSGQQPHPNWSGPHGPQDHAIRMHQQGHEIGMGMGAGPPSGGWGQSPYPQMNSVEMNNNYSRGTTPPSVLPSPSLGLAHSANGGTFIYEELAAATNNFSNENIIGQGGFGYVHKGVLPNGKEVAVKSLKSGSGQGEREFQAEIDIISRVHHRHLVSLVGYCISGGQRMLVYEFVPNQTLEHHLHGKGVPTMDWPTRMRIARGSAKGLAYLHEDCNPRIIHRDIKAANVLLDASFEAKVADFGLAKLTTDNNTHVSTRVMGTFGYLAPEYASSGKLTDKSDVFSFGVMLLELITGKRPIDLTNAMDDSLVDWARPLLSSVLEDNPNYGELVDPFLEGNYNSQEMARMVACAAASIRHSAKKRAKMSQIVRVLEGDVSLQDLKDVVNNSGSGQSNIYTSSSGSSEYDTMQYNADILKFRKAIMSSQEFGDSTELSSKEY